MNTLGLSDSTITLLILAGVVALFVSNRIPIGIVALSAALALYFTGILGLSQTLAGFGDPVVIFIATLFVISEGLDATGVTAWVGQQLIARAGDSQTRLLVLMMLLVAALSALISPNGSVAALLPVVVVTAIRLGRSPGLLLMPLAFAAHAGSLLLLTGTPVSVLISEAAVNAGEQGFGFFEYAQVGIPLVVGTIVIVVLSGSRLLPQRTARSIPPNLSEYARTMRKHYRLPEGPVPLGVESHSPTWTPGSAVADANGAQSLISGDYGVAELVIPPRSGSIGMPVFPGMVTSSGDLMILAVQRQGEDLGPQECVLRVGDTLLVQGSWDALEANVDDADVLVVDSPELVRRQAVPMGPGAGRAIAVLVAFVVLLASGAVPAAIAGLLAAGAMILLGAVTVNQAYRAIQWTTIVLTAGMIPLSVAITQTGAAALIAQALVRVVGEGGPYVLLVGLVLLTAVLGQLISNMATALVVIPIALSAAATMGVSGRPLLMAVNVAVAAAFLTPVATAANVMVMGPGGYRFTDYWKLGLPLLLWFIVVATVLVPLFWRF